jgi:hypothetical protein
MCASFIFKHSTSAKACGLLICETTAKNSGTDELAKRSVALNCGRRSATIVAFERVTQRLYEEFNGAHELALSDCRRESGQSVPDRGKEQWMGREMTCASCNLSEERKELAKEVRLLGDDLDQQANTSRTALPWLCHGPNSRGRVAALEVPAQFAARRTCARAS